MQGSNEDVRVTPDEYSVYMTASKVLEWLENTDAEWDRDSGVRFSLKDAKGVQSFEASQRGYQKKKRGEQGKVYSDEEQSIIDKAKSDGSFMKAPNGKPTKLTEKQWLQVRTQAFKDWFGDWEKTLRIEKLKDSNPIEISGQEHEGKYELNIKSAHRWILDNLRKEYTIKDTGESISLSRVSANEVTSHGEREDMHLRSFAFIPKMIENAIFIEEQGNYKNNKKYDSYRYYVVGLNVGDTPYTARVVVGVKNGKTYYDHELTKIEKGTLIDSLNRTTTSVAENQNPLSDYKDTRLLSLLQTNSSKVVEGVFHKLCKLKSYSEKF